MHVYVISSRLTRVPSTFSVERKVSSTNGARKTGFLQEKNETASYLSPYTTINSK